MIELITKNPNTLYKNIPGVIVTIDKRTGEITASQLLKKGFLYTVKTNNKITYFSNEKEDMEIENKKPIKEIKISDYNFQDQNGAEINLNKEKIAITPEEDQITETKKIIKDSLEEGLIEFENQKALPIIKEKKEIEQQLEILQERYREIKKTDITDNLIKAQSKPIEGQKITKIEIKPKSVIIDIKIPRLVFPVCFLPDPGRGGINPERTVAWRMFFPTNEATIRITHFLRDGVIKAEKITNKDVRTTMHVNKTNVCLGTYELTIRELAKKQDYQGIANIIADYICTYNADSPFFRVDTPFWTSRMSGRLENLMMWDKGRRAIVHYYDDDQKIPPNELRASLLKEIEKEIQEEIEKLKSIKIPDWVTAKTGLNKMFQIMEVPIEFARAQKEGVYWDETLEKDDFNKDLFTFIN